MLNENSILQDRMSNIKKRQTIAELLGISNRFKHLKMSKGDNSKYISQILFSFNITEQNPDLDIMISELANFRRQSHENKEKNKGRKEAPSSKNSLFHFLEKNLLEISYISNKEKRYERIKKLYEWFKNKQKYEEDINTITMKTYKEKDEIDEEEALLMKKKDEKEKIIDDSAHRNLELIKKNMLNEYERKRLRGPSWSMSGLSSSQDLDPFSILGKDSMMQTLSMLSATDFQAGDFTTLYSSINGTNDFTNHKFNKDILCYSDKPEGGLLEKDYISPIFQEQNTLLPPINKETKYSYSFLRPTYNFNDVYIENKIIENKQKSLALKRAQEEIKEKVKEFGINRARYKENLNNKYELKNIINMYVNRNKLSSPLLRKYKIKENSEDLENKNNMVINDNNKTNNINNNYSISNFSSPIRTNPCIKNSNSSIIEEKSNEENKLYNNILSPDESKKPEKTSFKSKNEFNKEKLNSSMKKVSLSYSQKIKVFELKDEKEGADSSKRNSKFAPKRALSFRKKTKFVKKRSYSQSSINAGIKLFSGINNKVINDNIQNIDVKSNNTLDLKDVKKQDYNLSIPPDIIKSEMIDKNKNNIQKSSDTFTHIIYNLPLIKEKILSGEICNIKSRNQESKNYESKSFQDNYGSNQKFYLSALNKEIIPNINKSINQKNYFKVRKNHFTNLNQRYNLYKDNFLKMRKSMSNDKKKEYELLVDRLRAKRVSELYFNEDYEEDSFDNENLANNSNTGLLKPLGLKKENSLLEAIVNPNDNPIFSRYYLPRNGSMLLSRDELNKKMIK